MLTLLKRLWQRIDEKTPSGIDLRLAHAGSATASISPDRLVNWRTDPQIERIGTYGCCTCCCPPLCVDTHRDPCPNKDGAA